MRAKSYFGNRRDNIPQSPAYSLLATLMLLQAEA